MLVQNYARTTGPRPLVSVVSRRLLSDSARLKNSSPPPPPSITSSSSQKRNSGKIPRKAFVAATAAVAASAGIYVSNSYSNDLRNFVTGAAWPSSSLIRNDGRPGVVSPAPSTYAGQLGEVQFPRAAGFSTKGLKTLTDDEVSAKLREHEEAYKVERGNGVVRFDVAQLASNSQIEDDYAAKIVNVNFADGESDWYFFGVFDGHGGWNTSAKLRELLVPYVARELIEAVKPDTVSTDYFVSTSANGRLVDRAIEIGFQKLDDDIVKKPINFLLDNPYKPASPELLMPAMSGSCALLSLYDSATQTLRVACTGDSRAVLGHRDSGGKWVATPLSYDQCGRNVSEVKRLREEHPDEKDTVVRRGRVLGGLEPTRAFGDARYKVPTDVLNQVGELFFGRSTPGGSLKSPPYVTARPEVITTKVKPGDFLVLATDGIWDELSCKEVVQLVVEWMRKAEINTGRPAEGITSAVRHNGIMSRVSDLADIAVRSDTEELNARVEAPDVTDEGKATLRNLVAGVKHFRGLFTIKDKNVATHLVRNALGGADTDETAMLVSLPPPMSRRYRDDMTAVVVFFGEPDGEGKPTGKVVQIAEATAGGKGQSQ
ncbi:phosphatase 2C-like domain-containing protein [Lipomyces japonicus]|uniref:phosphatase 2C-like domain-containing protein n=1 Tax=Lipomyces japonicus TaxID=56871 RepID=UPI0034CEC8F9